ncbi:class I SAM-dependent methyltransferase [Bacillus sp. FJAT-49732]|uniref:Class I SAM-dependent methyltransferase n=1 Tax=Lederbergia citrisecunda TaxID=2833583 RepID=A0A942TRW5_9BACI|nr:class I SAM-dependent methyltransferase [Lederbergia citrisecunda]MBS4201792.1 class I SAM-dependent methyltransferase [Lederbergia citrisecunda]
MVNVLSTNKQSWDEAAERFFGRNPLPEYGPMAPCEDELNLFGDVKNLKVLDIGCGSGHSLQYMKEREAAELWGLDLSKKQIELATTLLENSAQPVRLFESPMEVNPGLPYDYYDIVYSIFAIGWTTNLEKTLANINSYLKKGGIFIFSWEHPLYSRIGNKDGVLTFGKSYHEEGSYDHEAWNSTAIMQQFRVSTYINALVDNGFQIERVIEDARWSEEDAQRHEKRWYTYEKAKAIPTTLIVKCRKL